MPDAGGLTRAERKLLALRTCKAQAAEVEEAPDKLFVYRPGRWSQVNLGWDPADDRFLGWYVNFELPAQPTPFGLSSKDLVLDIWVDPDGSWQWKDRDDFETAIDDGLLEPSLRRTLADETERTLAELEQRTGPFADRIAPLRPHSTIPTPQLPAEFAWGGSEWTLPPGRRAGRVP